MALKRPLERKGGGVMAENTISDQVWTHLIKKYGDNGAVMLDPPTAGKMTREYQDEMRRLGFCPYCEGPLDDNNHINGDRQLRLEPEPTLPLEVERRR